MAINLIEALVDAIGHCNGINSPESEAYRLRNPLLLKSFARPGKHFLDDKGRRVFDSFQAGYKASCFDIQLKITGKSRAGLKPDDAIVNLLGCYGLKEKLAQDKIVNWLRKALQDISISANTPLAYFLRTESVPEPEVQ